MGRSTKQGIDYFSLDCALDDKTEMYVIETGATGYGVLITLWQMIYANEGYYIKADDDLLLLTKKRINADINEIDAYIKTAIKRDIFDSKLYEAHGILTSRAIQKRYFDAAKRKKTVRVVTDFLLIDVYEHINEINADIKTIDAGINATKEKEKEKEKEKIYTPKINVDDKLVMETFDYFWGIYPRKDGKANALKAWQKLKPNENLFNQIIHNVRQRLAARDWCPNTNKQFIPHASTFLNGERWNDEPIPNRGLSHAERQAITQQPSATDRASAENLAYLEQLRESKR